MQYVKQARRTIPPSDIFVHCTTSSTAPGAPAAARARPKMLADWCIATWFVHATALALHVPQKAGGCPSRSARALR